MYFIRSSLSYQGRSSGSTSGMYLLTYILSDIFQASWSKRTFSSSCHVSNFFNAYQLWTRYYLLNNYLAKSIGFFNMEKSVWKIEKNYWNGPPIICINKSTSYISKAKCKAWPRMYLANIAPMNFETNISTYYARSWQLDHIIINGIKIKTCSIIRSPCWFNCRGANFYKLNLHLKQ